MLTTIPPKTDSLLREIRFIADFMKSVGGLPTYSLHYRKTAISGRHHPDDRVFLPWDYPVTARTGF
ncbi:MAG: hypothetical protein GQ541_01510 [Desulfovibrionaceae bacterium]|nr:hypothetical protein [Desulfovibrionaceae bacterium]